MKPRTPPPAKIPPTADDVWQAETNEKCARSIAAWLKATVNTQRPINTLKIEELKSMADNVLATFIVEASQRVRADVSDDERKRIEALLT
jgi:hypothetical protein